MQTVSRRIGSSGCYLWAIWESSSLDFTPEDDYVLRESDIIPDYNPASPIYSIFRSISGMIPDVEVDVMGFGITFLAGERRFAAIPRRGVGRDGFQLLTSGLIDPVNGVDSMSDISGLEYASYTSCIDIYEDTDVGKMIYFFTSTYMLKRASDLRHPDNDD